MFGAKIRIILHFFHLKIIFFTTVKNCSIMHGRVFVMILHAMSSANVVNKVNVTKLHYFTTVNKLKI